MFNGLNLTDILGASEKIQAFIPQIKKFIPTLIAQQNEFAKKHKLTENEMLLYSVLLSLNGKIILYAFKCFQTEKEFEIEGVKFNGGVIIKDELFRVELTQYLDTIEKDGLMGLVQSLPMDALTGFMK